eukprot:CAMPEP_0119526954 /NCGR_PEP_ID=MMETSP1344-20130328/41464_1 /TAXON_ID=236787 /ORGANISM="Florenciella parvula, Strain CCMP2471" /LENGTH=181 /DNA_ID=CAMNT_0007566063 /DNA_START=326 /DNA_END=872 /DNA_ORIENTATION=+
MSLYRARARCHRPLLDSSWRRPGLFSWNGAVLVALTRFGGGRRHHRKCVLLGYVVVEAKKRHRVMCARLRTPTRGTSHTTSPPTARVLPLAPPSPHGESGGPAELEFMSLPVAALSSSSCSFLSATRDAQPSLNAWCSSLRSRALRTRTPPAAPTPTWSGSHHESVRCGTQKVYPREPIST